MGQENLEDERERRRQERLERRKRREATRRELGSFADEESTESEEAPPQEEPVEKAPAVAAEAAPAASEGRDRVRRPRSERGRQDGKYTVLVVDDEPDNLELLRRTFRREYNVLAADSGFAALDAVKGEDVALIISDQRMPGMTGAEMLARTVDTHPDTIRLILTAYTDVKDLISAINEGKVYRYVTKPWDPDELKLTVTRALEAYQLQLDNKMLLERLRENFAKTLQILAVTLDARDPYTAGHTGRVAYWSLEIAARINLSEEEKEILRTGSFLHDIGKIGVKEAVLHKNGRLTDEEYQHIMQHPSVGARIIEPMPDLAPMIPVVKYHHEKLDGTGYPEGLKGDQIPLLARIASIADIYDALVTDRPYRKGMPREQALEIVESAKGKHLDPDLTAIFTEIVQASPTDLPAPIMPGIAVGENGDG